MNNEARLRTALQLLEAVEVWRVGISMSEPLMNDDPKWPFRREEGV